MNNPKDFLQIEYISLVGFMLVVVFGLCKAIHILYKENKKKDGEILNMTQKYYEIATKLNQFLEKF